MCLIQLMRQAHRQILFIRLRMAAMSALTLFTMASIEARAQTDASSADPVVVQAEEGALGTDFAVFEDGDVDYVSIQTDLLASGYPGSNDRIASYEVAFPASGTYDLYARIRVGPGTFNDDSFFYGNGFGEKAPELESDWRTVNNVQTAGFTDPNAYVVEAGNATGGVWKWVNLTRNDYHSPGITFTVEEDALTQIIQIGGREDGLDIDRLAFGRSDLYYTVANLNAEEAGSPQLPNGDQNGRPLADELDKFLGNIYSTSQIADFEMTWNQVTPENAGKWGSVEVNRDAMNWGPLDAAYDLAKDNGFPFRFHVLVWGNQQPSWIENLPTDDQLEEIEEWFNVVAERYPDIDYLEVVNEPLHDPPVADNGGYIDALGGAGETGWDWVLTAFRMARDIFPETVNLMINDYGILGSDLDVSRYLEVIELLQEEDLIDGIGVQGHAFSTRGSAAAMTRRLDNLAATGLPIQVTEMDIDGPTDEQQLSDYERIFPALWEHPAVEGITLWGWRPGMWRTDQGAYLVRQDGTERPAFEWLRGYMATQTVSVDSKPDLANVLIAVGNYPNPFSGSTNIVYELSRQMHVNVTIYDARGREVSVLVDGVRSPGRHHAAFRAEGLGSGPYVCRIVAEGTTRTKLLMHVR